MAEIFVSYSRRDEAFLARLRQELAKHEYELWIDTHNILVSAKWADEIENAILSCPHFLFLISPTSVASAQCISELNIAERACRRIIPVLCEATAWDAIPECIKQFQLFLFLDHEAIDTLTTALAGVIGADPKDRRALEVLAVKGREWQVRGRPRELLLAPEETEWAVGLAQRAPSFVGMYERQFLEASVGAAICRGLWWKLALAAGATGTLEILILSMFGTPADFLRSPVVILVLLLMGAAVGVTMWRCARPYMKLAWNPVPIFSVSYLLTGAPILYTGNVTENVWIWFALSGAFAMGATLRSLAAGVVGFAAFSGGAGTGIVSWGVWFLLGAVIFRDGNMARGMEDMMLQLMAWDFALAIAFILVNTIAAGLLGIGMRLFLEGVLVAQRVFCGIAPSDAGAMVAQGGRKIVK